MPSGRGGPSSASETQEGGPRRPADLSVARLRFYPVKGAAGVDVDELRFDEFGPRFDRRWLVAAPTGAFCSQRDTPELACLTARVDPAGGLVLNRPGGPALHVPPSPDGAPFPVRVWDSEVVARSCGAQADAWLSEWLDAERRLAFMADDDVRLADPRFAEGRRVSFGDGYPALVVTEAAVEELARRAGRPVPADRFRPNVVVRGAGPHDEDQWRRFSAGSLSFSGVKLCARCKVTTIDQATGQADPASEPLRALARYRKIESQVFFGLNAVHDAPGRVRVGDPVQILERAHVPAGPSRAEPSAPPRRRIFGRHAGAAVPDVRASQGQAPSQSSPPRERE